MNPSSTRRRFLKGALAGGAAFGLPYLNILSGLPPVGAEEARLPRGIVPLRAEIEPLVKFIEETPREQLLEEVAGRICRGLSYREILAALLLAGVRNVEPRPSVGFKFHAVLVVHSAHLASLSSPDEDRWLPIFWALDYFKSSQARDVAEGNWTMSAVDEARVPSASAARREFIHAMENWDEEAADAAAAGLARSAGAGEISELFFRYGGRDFRSIGHKAIFVANSFRTLDCIGWEHAEPVVRSLAYALLNHEGDNPAKRDAEADRPWRQNTELAGSLRQDWSGGSVDAGATRELLEGLRSGSESDASTQVAALLNRGVAPQSAWDGLLAGATELLLRAPGIVGLHAVTSTNALYQAFTKSRDDSTRRLLLLQNAAFLPLFREAIIARGQTLADSAVDLLDAAEPEGAKAPSLEEIFTEIGNGGANAARKTLAYLKQGDARDLVRAARRLIFLKGTDSHDYKFSSAVLEDYYHTSPAWRDRYLAASVVQLRGSNEPDNPLVERIQGVLKAHQH